MPGGGKGWEDTFRHLPAGRDRSIPEEQPWLNTIPCPLQAPLLWLCVHNVLKQGVLGPDDRAGGEGSDCKGLCSMLGCAGAWPRAALLPFTCALPALPDDCHGCKMQSEHPTMYQEWARTAPVATRSHDKPPLMASASQPSYQGHPAQGHPRVSQSCCHLSLVLICRALASILAPVSPMALPLMSRETRLVLLPRALSRTLVPSLRRDSATDSDWRGWKRDKEGTGEQGSR